MVSVNNRLCILKRYGASRPVKAHRKKYPVDGATGVRYPRRSVDGILLARKDESLPASSSRSHQPMLTEPEILIRILCEPSQSRSPESRALRFAACSHRPLR